MEITVFWDVTQHILTNRYHNCRHLSLSLALKQFALTSFKTYDGSRWIITFLYGPKYSKKCVLYHISILFPQEYSENDFGIKLNQFNQPEDGEESSSEISEQIYTTNCLKPKDHLDLMTNWWDWRETITCWVCPINTSQLTTSCTIYITGMLPFLNLGYAH